MIFTKQDLYGGGITTTIPAGLTDASTLRQIPDTQEVFLNPSSNDSDVSEMFKDDSIIIELLERLDTPDDKGIHAHISELSNLNSVGENEWKLLKTEKVIVPNLQEDPAFIATGIEPSKKWGRPDGNVSLIIVAGLIRIARVETDALITFNSPVSQTQFGDQIIQLEQGNLPEDSDLKKKIATAEAVVREALTNFTVQDWRLFA